MTLNITSIQPLPGIDWNTGPGPTYSYEQIAMDVCNNIDDRIKFIAILLPIVWMLGNWLYNKSHDGKFIDKYGSDKTMMLPWLVWGYRTKKWIVIEPTSIKDLILDIIVPVLRSMLLYGFGFLIYYTQISGGGM